MGFRVTHLYGLTESYGPATLCAWQDEWGGLPLDGARAADGAPGRARCRRSRQCRSAIPTTGAPVPRDGATIGEVMLRGNTIMKGYLERIRRRPTRRSRDGWFHTATSRVWHADGYVEIKDRTKDIIISGGENISSLEVEECLYRHPQVMEAAVVARPDAKWGETPCAFVTLKPDAPRRRRATTSSPGAASTSRTSRCRARSCSVRCRRPRPARSRSSCCATQARDDCRRVP